MANKMLIDASHPEETRVVVLRGNRVEDFDFESASKKPLRGNIYLAKVTRVEPSLQAAFIEYGGNRHGFLAFSEIHPDYYQIPVADRQALLDEEARAHREEDEDHRPSARENGNGNGGGHGRRSRRHRRERQPSEKRADLGDESLAEPIESFEVETVVGTEAAEGRAPEDRFEAGSDVADERDGLGAGEEMIEASEPQSDVQDDSVSAPDEDEPVSAELEAPSLDEQPSASVSDDDVGSASAAASDEVTGNIEEIEPDEDDRPAGDHDHASVNAADGSEENEDQGFPESNGHADEEEEPVEQIGGDALEETTYRAPRLRRHYKIQEVIKRRQILLVQVVKEERGNKGAALTTYLSLAGRYSVLMPNTARGGGISRKITDADDRKRLKSIAQELDVPEGMGIILRTAGAARGETEVKRDFEYLLRMWETVRETTLSSSAPKLVYEEGSLIKRSIRDLYSKEIDEIWVSGDGGYREAKDYMRLLMPTHTKNVHAYKDTQPIFAKGGAEAQLDAMFSNHVTLKSGGYIVINQTEALVAIDVNSGRSTREHNIEDTAVRTNLEAADEVARQLRLRDLAGLIVVDFIDMEEGRNDRAVERRIKDALKNDRARIQIGRISHFGLLEMSRQRIRTGVLEGSTVICPHCAGAGTVRSTSSIALHVLRVLEDTLIRSASHNLIVRTRTEVALYILNQKRANLADLEQRFGVTIVVMADADLTGTVYHSIDRGELATPPVSALRSNVPEDEDEFETAEEEAEADDLDGGDADTSSAGEPDRANGDEDETGANGGRRRRRRRRRGRDRETRSPGDASDEAVASDQGESSEGGETEEGGIDLTVLAEAETMADGAVADLEADLGADPGADLGASADVAEPLEAAAEPEAESDEASAEEAPEPRRRRRSRRSATRPAGDEEPAAEASAGEGSVAPARRSRRARTRPVEDEAPTLLSFEPPSADRDVGADTAINHPADSEPASSAQSTESVALADLALQTQPTDQGSAEAAATPPAADAPEEPPRPKRSGWWQRAKATLTGE